MRFECPHPLRKAAFSRSIGLLAALLALLLAACGGSQPASPQVAVDIHKDDVCAVCGMYIEAGPGPRAEAYVQGYKAPLKFGSTRDFFAYVLQPENKTRLQDLLVQDSARINWTHPSNAAGTFVDARTAFYVAWQPLPGLMGPTFASFAAKKDAQAFVGMHGGKIMQFSGITADLTSALGFSCPAQGAPESAVATGCITPAHPADSPLAAQDEHTDLLPRLKSVPHETDPARLGNRSRLLNGSAH